MELAWKYFKGKSHLKYLSDGFFTLVIIYNNVNEKYLLKFTNIKYIKICNKNKKIIKKIMELYVDLIK